LADTIIDANEAAVSAGAATGFQFSPLTSDAFLHAVRRAVEAYAQPAAWGAIQKQGMRADVSWSRSADRYVGLYKSLLARKSA
ncbi:MAG: starch synthase, partial [Rhizobiales bacterium]|nr:starch synthase [Hyphomicrobiales bacterium]